MDFTYNETQLAVQQAATEVLDSAAPEAAWKALGQAGLLSLSLPETLGGDSLGMVETGIVLTETGRRALITPAFPALPLALALTRSHHTGLLTPDTFLTFTLTPHPPTSPPAPTSPSALPSPLAPSLPGDGIGGARSGGAGGGASAGDLAGGWVAAGVPFGAEASHVLVVRGGEATAAKVIAAEAGYSSSGIPEYTVTLDEAGPSISADCYPYLLAAVAACADGLLAGALTLTTEHLRTREQFGKPLATFQIAAALIADVYIASRTMHLIALSLAWGLDTGRDVTADVEAAEHWLRTEAVAALRTCHHLHGGIGLDVTYPLHRYYSLMKDLVRYVHRPH